MHNLEPEDLRALSLEASAFTGVPLAGVDWMVGPATFRWLDLTGAVKHR